MENFLSFFCMVYRKALYLHNYYARMARESIISVS